MTKRKEVAVFELHGGAGNQLFQLAAADYYSRLWKCNITFDVTHVVDETWRYSLDRTHSTALSALGFQLDCVTNSRCRIFFEKVFRKSAIGKKYFSNRVMFPRILSDTYESNVIGFDRLFEELSPRRFFGYFQTYLYCSLALNQMLTKLVISRHEPMWVRTHLNKMGSQRILLLHARFYNSKDAETYVNLESSYYENAISFFGGRDKFDDVWLITNEPGRARSEFSPELLRGLTILEKPKGVDDLSILHLMTASKYLVIANSSFSWWGAHLGDKSKIIVAPKEIYNSMANPTEYYPSEWILLAL